MEDVLFRTKHNQLLEEIKYGMPQLRKKSVMIELSKADEGLELICTTIADCDDDEKRVEQK